MDDARWKAFVESLGGIVPHQTVGPDEFTIHEVAERLQISYQRAWRLVRRWLAEGTITDRGMLDGHTHVYAPCVREQPVVPERIRPVKLRRKR
jgi:hypothetical protein